jgi:hypothetical protein
MSTQLNELRLQVERLDYDNKEGVITIDILKEQNQDARNELEELKKLIAELQTAQRDASIEDKEKRKQEKMALMMAKFDTVGQLPPYRFIVIADMFTAGCLLGEGRTASIDSCKTRQYRHGGLFIARRPHCYPATTF